MAVKNASGENMPFDRLGSRADDNIHPWIARLADAADHPIAKTDISLEFDIDHQRIDHRVNGAIGAAACDWPIPSRMTLPPPNFTSSP